MDEELATRRLVELAAENRCPPAPPETERAERRRLLMAAEMAFLESSRPRAHVWVAAGALSVAAAGAAIAALLWFVHRPPPLTFVASSNAELSGNYVSAQRGPGRLGFSDGSELLLEPGTRLHIQEASPDGVTLLLESGATSSQIVHHTGRRWLLAAGAFEIRITGTRFRTSWDPSKEAFELSVEQGSVVVRSYRTGAIIPLSAGNHLQADGRTGRWSVGEDSGQAERPSHVASPP